MTESLKAFLRPCRYGRLPGGPQGHNIIQTIHDRGEVKKRMEAISGLCKDFVISHMRSQLLALNAVLEEVEHSRSIDESFVISALRNIECELRHIRRSLNS